MHNKDLSIVIPTWNRRSLLHDCLRSIFHWTRGVGFEVVVVDNGSTDGTVEMIREGYPSVRVIANRENLGFSRGCNQGIQASSGRFFAVLNNDTVLLEDAFSKLVSFLDAHPAVGAVGPRLVTPGGLVQESAMGAFIDLRSALFGGEYFSRFLRRLFPFWSRVPEMVTPVREQDRPLEVAWLVGACILGRRAVTEQAGLFDEKIFMYIEDMEWCYRVRKAGWTVFYYPQARIRHLDHTPTKDSMSRVMSQHMGNQVYFYRKHKGAVPAVGLGVALFLGSLIKLPGFVLLSAGSRIASGKRTGRLEFKVRFHYHALRYFFSLPFSRFRGKRVGAGGASVGP